MATDALARIRAQADEMLALLQQAREHRAAGRQGPARKADAQAASLMTDSALSRWLVRSFERRKVSAGEAEELAMDVWTKLIDRGYTVDRNPFALVCTMARSRFSDYVRHRHATGEATAVVQAPEPADDQDGPGLDDYTAGESYELSPLQDCVRRKAMLLEASQPDVLELLEYRAVGLSYAEIASIVYDKPLATVSLDDAHNMRSRVYEARKKAKAWFAECRD